MEESDKNVVHETDNGTLNRTMAQQFVGETCGLFLQRDVDGFDGDGITGDSTVDDITTEPTSARGYERLVLKNNENPTFDVGGYDGAVDAVFFADDGDLLAAFPLGIPVRLVADDDMTEVTPQIFPENGAE